MKWTIKQNENNNKWYFSVSDLQSKADCVFPDYEDIMELARKNGLSTENLINARQFARYFDKIVYGKPLPLPLEIELDPSFDSRLIIDSDKTKATLYIRKPQQDPHSIDKRLINTMLNNSGIQNVGRKSKRLSRSSR